MKQRLSHRPRQKRGLPPAQPVAPPGWVVVELPPLPSEVALQTVRFAMEALVQWEADRELERA